MNEPMSRRAMLATLMKASAVGCGLVAALPALASADAAGITVYKDPSCGCCTKWVEHLRAAGLRPVVHDRSDMDALKDSLGVPPALRSCHTAVAGKYVVEGHVPAADVTRLLAAKPRGVLGLAVPDMPAGAPGMEMSGRRDAYDVVAFSANGKSSVFARH
jgi:Predicted metal-binding protein